MVGLPKCRYRVAQPHQSQADDDMHSDVRSRPEVFFAPDHCEGLAAKCRKGREAAEDTDESERTKFRPEKLPGFSESGYHSDREATHEVDHQRSVGEGGQRNLPMHQSAKSVAGESTQETSRTDQDSIDQNCFQACLRIGAYWERFSGDFSCSRSTRDLPAEGTGTFCSSTISRAEIFWP